MSNAYFRVEGVNLERQLNQLIKSGAEVSHVKRPEKQVLLFAAPAAQRRQIVDFFKERCYNITVENVRGFAVVIEFCRRRIALLAALVLLTASLLYLSGYVWRVEIECDERVDAAALETVLKNCGAWKGSPVNGIDYKLTQKAIFNALPNIKYAGVSVRGSTLFVSVISEDEPEPVFDFKTPRDIVAEFDGIITRVVVISGTALVKAGDTVTKGQVLIQGMRTFPDQSQEPVCAIGEVYANAVFTAEEQFLNNITVQKKTGNKKTFFAFSLFKFYHGGYNQDIYENQVVEESSEVLFPLPVKIYTITVYETKSEQVKQDFEALKGEYEQKALLKALKAFEGQIITRTEFTHTTNDAGVVIKALVYSERKVSVYP